MLFLFLRIMHELAVSPSIIFMIIALALIQIIGEIACCQRALLLTRRFVQWHRMLRAESFPLSLLALCWPEILSSRACCSILLRFSRVFRRRTAVSLRSLHRRPLALARLGVNIESQSYIARPADKFPRIFRSFARLTHTFFVFLLLG